MPVVYFKRYKMQIDLLRFAQTHVPGESVLRFVPWSERVLGQHALAKWDSFRLEIDANVFPCLGDRDGCRQLIRDISLRTNFVPEATWLAMADPEGKPEVPVGTIQGLRLNALEGAIQNIGVVPQFRGLGIGRELLQRALQGFRETGCIKVNLEVTVHNTGAIRLYESIGFHCIETVFKVGNVPVNS
jgi:GNAT superfamily N-acetyltransferase